MPSPQMPIPSTHAQTVFEEVGGLGVWRRYWCQLRADHLQFWRYPEEEQNAAVTTPGNAPACLYLRNICAPSRAVPAPRRICARSNSIFMRSLRRIDPASLSAAVATTNTEEVEGAKSSAASNESLIFRSSSDYTWLEQQ